MHLFDYLRKNIFKPKRKTFETTIFWNENHYFNEKVESTLSYADFLVISEGCHSFSMSQTRPYKARSLVKKLPPKLQKRIFIVEVDYSLLNLKTAWDREHYLRDSGFCFLEKNNLIKDDDIVIVQDFDEFSNSTLIAPVLKSFSEDPNQHVLHLSYYCSYFFLNLRITSPENHERWLPPVIFKAAYLSSSGEKPHQLRFQYNNLFTTNFVGWHHSYLGNKKFIIDKIKSFSHFQDENVKDITEKEIEKAIYDGNDLFGRDGFFFEIINYQDLGIDQLKNRMEFIR